MSIRQCKFLVYMSGLTVGLAVLSSAVPSSLQAADNSRYVTKARQALLMEAKTGSLLYEHNADASLPPASMSKLVTLAVVFRAIRAGKLNLTDEFVVSENAWRTGGAPSRTSSMFVPINTSATLEQMIRGMIVQSGNDAAIAIAEGMAGSEQAFAKLMAAEAARIGLTNSSFANATGLPHPKQLMSARDLAILSRHLIYTYPKFYKYFAEREFNYRRFRFINRNRLLFLKLGVDGLKTGYTKSAGYSIVASAKKGERRLIAVIGGMKTKNERWSEARRIIEWGFDGFSDFKVFNAGEIVGRARVWGGSSIFVSLVGNGDVKVLLPRYPVNQKLRGQVVYEGPLKPPIRKGDQVAMLRVRSSTGTTSQVPLFAAEDVERGGLARRGLDSLFHLAFGWIP